MFKKIREYFKDISKADKINKAYHDQNKRLNIHPIGTFAEKNEESNCASCRFHGLCVNTSTFDKTDHYCFMKDFDPSKETILLIDDNKSVVDILIDDFKEFDRLGLVNLLNYNLLCVTGNHAAFNLYSLQQRANGLNIKYAIIDLVYFGFVRYRNEPVKYDGVDVCKFIKDYTPNSKILFHGSELNPILKSHKIMIQKFKLLCNDSIEQHLLDKTIVDIEERRSIILEELFGKVY